MGNYGSNLLSKEDIREIESKTDFKPKQIKKLHERFRQLDKTKSGYLNRYDFLKIPDLAINPLANWIIDIFFMNAGRTYDPEADESMMSINKMTNGGPGLIFTKRPSTTELPKAVRPGEPRPKCPRENLMLEKGIEKIDFIEFCKILSNFKTIDYHSGAFGALGTSRGADSDGRRPSYASSSHTHGSCKKDIEAQTRLHKLKFLFQIYRLYNEDDDLEKQVLTNSDLLILLRMMVGCQIKSCQLKLIADRIIAETDADQDGVLTFSEFAEGFKYADLDGEMAVKFEN